MFYDQSGQVYFSWNSSDLHFSLGLGLSLVCETGGWGGGVEYSYFSRISEVQHIHVHTLITLLPSWRTFRRILCQDTHMAAVNRLMTNKRAWLQQRCHLFAHIALQIINCTWSFRKIKNETPKTVYGTIAKTNYMFIREILGTSDGVVWGHNDVPLIDLCTIHVKREHERIILKQLM